MEGLHRFPSFRGRLENRSFFRETESASITLIEKSGLIEEPMSLPLSPLSNQALKAFLLESMAREPLTKLRTARQERDLEADTTTYGRNKNDRLSLLSEVDTVKTLVKPAYKPGQGIRKSRLPLTPDRSL